MTQPVVRVAMWSGPRTVSTALMRSFGNQPDTIVADEPGPVTGRLMELFADLAARTGTAMV